MKLSNISLNELAVCFGTSVNCNIYNLNFDSFGEFIRYIQGLGIQGPRRNLMRNAKWPLIFLTAELVCILMAVIVVSLCRRPRKKPSKTDEEAEQALGQDQKSYTPGSITEEKKQDEEV